MTVEDAMRWAIGQDPEIDHVPALHPFECDACGEVWPCYKARSALIVTYRNNPARLYAYLSARMVYAFQVAAMRTSDVVPDAQAIWHRFVGWAPAAFKTQRKMEVRDAASDAS